MRSFQEQDLTFEGEELEAGFASPTLDLIASLVLFCLAGIVIVASLFLPVPGDLRTAPGLLPILTAIALGAMALLLGKSALLRRRQGGFTSKARDFSEDSRALALALAVAIYIAALQLLAFQSYFSIFGLSLVLSAFEPVTILALVCIIKLSWRGPFWIAALISTAWTVALSLVFQVVFQIPLPGGY